MMRRSMALLAVLATVVFVARAGTSAAAPPLTAAQKSCEHQVGGTFVVGGTESFIGGLPVIYRCMHGTVQSTPEVRSFEAQCEHAYGGFPTTFPNDTPVGPGGFFCLAELPPNG